MNLPNEPHKKLTSKQYKAWKAMRALLSDNLDAADKQYDAFEESENGKVISTDIARYLDKEYAKDPKGKLRDIEPGWELAWRYAENRLIYELVEGGKGKIFRMMAGGWAAGKTHAIRHLKSEPDLVWDGTLSRSTWAASIIELALKREWKVEIVYIYRNLELAMYGALEREKEERRSVPLKDLPKTHLEAQQSILELSLTYAGKPGVSFLYIHNLGRKDAIAEPLEIKRKELESRGALRYLKKHEQYYRTASKHLLTEDHSA